VSQVRTFAVLGAILVSVGIAGCDNNKRSAEASPNIDSAIEDGLKETTVPGMGVTTNVVARTGTMASGTQNSSTVAGAAPPGKTNPANAH
jgi:hypothetical protein